jgi:DNA-binding NarL/FixJ family response regulator
MEILVVDDHKLFLEGISYLLEKVAAGAVVTALSTFDEAMNCAATVERYDLILLDLNIGGGDGVALLQRYAELGVFTPVVTLSASEDLQHIQSALDAGSMGFISKSLSGDEMLAAIEQILAGELFLPEAIARALADQRDNRQDLLSALTKRQLGVLALLCQGCSNREIADQLFLTENTVKSHMMTLFQKMEVKNRTECVLMAQQNHLFTR